MVLLHPSVWESLTLRAAGHFKLWDNEARSWTLGRPQANVHLPSSASFPSLANAPKSRLPLYIPTTPPCPSNILPKILALLPKILLQCATKPYLLTCIRHPLSGWLRCRRQAPAGCYCYKYYKSLKLSTNFELWKSFCSEMLRKSVFLFIWTHISCRSSLHIYFVGICFYKRTFRLLTFLAKSMNF